MSDAIAARRDRLSVSTILLAMLMALIGGAIGAFAGGAIAAGIAAATNMSNVEGARGYFAVAIGLLVGLGTTVLAILFTLYRRGLRDARLALGLLLTIFGLAATAAAALGLYYISQPQILNRNGPPVQLQLELMGPAGATHETLLALEAEMNTSLNTATVYWRRDASERNENSRPVIEGYVDLYYRTAGRLLVLELANKEKRLFPLKLSANPNGAKYRDWSEWQGPTQIDRPDLQNPIPATGEPDFKIRYRVEVPGE